MAIFMQTKIPLSANIEHGMLPAANHIHALRTKDFKLVRYCSGDKAYVPANWEEEFYDFWKSGGIYVVLKARATSPGK